MSNLIFQSSGLRGFVNNDDTLKRTFNTLFLSVEDLHDFLNLIKARLEDHADYEIKEMGDLKKALWR